MNIRNSKPTITIQIVTPDFRRGQIKQFALKGVLNLTKAYSAGKGWAKARTFLVHQFPPLKRGFIKTFEIPHSFAMVIVDQTLITQ
jgi:hypothetical protein